jgi:sporulation protein YqfC
MDISKLANRFDKFKAGFQRHSYIHITDNLEIIIDCCRSIMTYDENIIKLRLINNSLTITGAGMIMRNFSTDGVIIAGKIYSVEFGGDV